MASAAAGAGAPAEVVLGEITTRLLDNSSPLPIGAARQALELVDGRRPTWRTHPVSRVVADGRPVGVDCDLATGEPGKPARVRAIGTVATRAVLTGGHVLQATAHARVLTGAATLREHWGHYTTRPGVIEVINKARARELGPAFLAAPRSPDLLDLAGIGAGVLDRVGERAELDCEARLKSTPRRLRWAVEVRPGHGTPTAHVEVDRDGGFWARFAADPADLPAILECCEDLALHDWLLETLQATFERAQRVDDQFDELSSAVEYLFHLWNPAAGLAPSVRHVWRALEAGPQLGWEWQATVAQVRDRISLLTLRALQASLLKEGSWGV